MVGAFQTRAVGQQQIADIKLWQHQRLTPLSFTGNPDQLLTVHILIQLRNTAQRTEMPYQGQKQIRASGNFKNTVRMLPGNLLKHPHHSVAVL